MAREIFGPRSQASPTGEAPTADTMNTVTIPPFNNAIESATEESVIVEFTRRLADREAKIRTITHQKMQLEFLVQNRHAGNGAGESGAYEMLLAHYLEREERLHVVSELNQGLEMKVKGLEKLVHELQLNSSRERLTMQEKERYIAKLEQDSKSNRSAILDAEDVIKTKEEIIDFLSKEKEDMNLKFKTLEERVKQHDIEITSYKQLVAKSKSLSEEQVKLLLGNEKTIECLEVKNMKLEKVTEGLKGELKKNAYILESKDVKINMQRQELEKQEELVRGYEAKFLAKDMDVYKIIARADEGDRLWSKIEEREKKVAAKEMIAAAIREENTSLQADKKRLQAEVDELKQCFEMYELKLSGTNDKVQMPWLLSQLRDTVQLREKISELEQVIRGEGYTIEAAEAVADFKEKTNEIALEMEKLVQTIEILKGQTTGVNGIEVPVLIGKLEECLQVFGYDPETQKQIIDDGETMTEIISAASTEMIRSMSLNTADSYTVDEKWVKSTCITTRDFKDLMDPEHYTVMNSLVEGFRSLKTEGLCNTATANEEEEEDAEEGIHIEDRNDIAEIPRADKGDKEDLPILEANKTCKEDSDSERDIHLQKVLKVIAQNEEELNDWRNWITPPSSPCSQNTATAE